MKIIEVSHSIANRYSDHIEINKNLKKYPELLKPILEHEMSHTDKSWSFQDFKLDFFSKSKVNFFSLIKFMFKHPASFLQLSPIIYSKKNGLILDKNLLIMYSIMFLVFLITISVGVRYL